MTLTHLLRVTNWGFWNALSTDKHTQIKTFDFITDGNIWHWCCLDTHIHTQMNKSVDSGEKNTQNNFRSKGRQFHHVLWHWTKVSALNKNSKYSYALLKFGRQIACPIKTLKIKTKKSFWQIPKIFFCQKDGTCMCSDIGQKFEL